MKQNGIIGLGSGKLGSTISSVRGGVQIQREHRSSIAKPSTEGQVAQRARIKLMAQLGAALKAIIAIPPMKLHTSRNLFSKANIGFVEVNDGVASIDYSKIQLTSSSFGCPSVEIARTPSAGVQVNMTSDARGCCNAIVYNLVKVNSNDKLQLVDSVVVYEAGEEGFFNYVFPYIDGRIVVYAYGIRLSSTKARAKYASYRINNGRDVASLVISRKIASPDFRVTCTVADTDEPNISLPIVSSVNSVPLQGQAVIITDSNDAIVLRGKFFSSHVWSLLNGDGSSVIRTGIVSDSGKIVTFDFALIGTFRVKYDDVFVCTITMSPYGCYIAYVNDVATAVGDNVSIPYNEGHIVILGSRFNSSWTARSNGSPGYLAQGNVTENMTKVTFDGAPHGIVFIYCDGRQVITLNIE